MNSTKPQFNYRTAYRMAQTNIDQMLLTQNLQSITLHQFLTLCSEQLKQNGSPVTRDKLNCLSYFYTTITQNLKAKNKGN